MKTKLHDFVICDGRLAAVIRNDSCGGVMRGHVDLWFGEEKDGKPILRQVYAGTCEPLSDMDVPVGIWLDGNAVRRSES